MRTRTPLGLWLRMSGAERAAWDRAYPGHYIDLDDLTGGDHDSAMRDLAEFREEMGMTDADYRAWTNPKQSGA